MSNFSSGFHRGCLFGYKIVRKNNRRILALVDKSCSWEGIPEFIHSKEKWKNLFDKKRISNLVYLEGLEVLKNLRKPKGSKEKENHHA